MNAREWVSRGMPNLDATTWRIYQVEGGEAVWGGLIISWHTSAEEANAELSRLEAAPRRRHTAQRGYRVLPPGVRGFADAETSVSVKIRRAISRI